MLFEQYPYPFVAGGDFNNAVVVVPDELTTEDTDSLANIFNLLGRFHDGNRGNLTAVHAANWKKAKEGSNVIAVGTMNNNPVIKMPMMTYISSTTNQVVISFPTKNLD